MAHTKARTERLWLLGVLVSVMALLVAACGTPEATPTPAPADEPTPTPAGEMEDWQVEWEETLAAARQEGRLVVVMGGAASRQFRPVLEHFGREFGINMEVSTGSGSAQTDRVLAEQNAGRYEVDIIMLGSGSGARMWDAGATETVSDYFFHPEVLDTSLWFGGQHFYASEGEHPGMNYSFAHSASAEPAPLGMWFNTDRLSIADAQQMTSVFDYLDDRFHGDIVALPPTIAGAIESYFIGAAHPQIGLEWFERFFQMDVTFMEDFRLISDGIAQGRWTMGLMLGSAGRDVEDLGEAGLPAARWADVVDHEVDEAPIMSSSGADNNLMVALNPPNRNAATLFVNWFLSREGQDAKQCMAEDRTDPSLRIDTTCFDMVHPADMRDPDREYFLITADPQFTSERQNLVNQLIDMYRASR